MSPERIIHWDPFSDGPLRLGSAVFSIGVFDGLHVGHRYLLDCASREAASSLSRLVVVTFDQDPDEYFVPSERRPGKLLSNERRLELIAEVSGATVVSVPASRGLFAMEPAAFLDALASVATPVAVFVGADFRFGSHAKGTVDDVDSWCARHGCDARPTPLLERGGSAVTATRIRGLLSQGRVEEARELLAWRAHSVEGRVVHGRGEGAGMGFATANLELAEGASMLPAEGVYGGYALVGGVSYPAAINVGAAKSFEGATAPLEAHLLGFAGDLYGKAVELSFIAWLREQRVFASRDELVATVSDNIEWVRRNLGGGADVSHR